jgi:hypothetical protein
VKRLVSELGFRYRPSAQADLEAHGATLALLAVDVTDIPPALLGRAIEEWARKSRFMPKAAELIELAQSYIAKPKGGTPDLQALADRGNARREGRRDIEWVVEGNDLKLQSVGPIRPLSTRPFPTIPQDQIIAYCKRVQRVRSGRSPASPGVEE